MGNSRTSVDRSPDGRIAASGPGVKSGGTTGASARRRSSNHSLSLSRCNRSSCRSALNSVARHLQAGQKVSLRSSVRLRRLGKQSRRDGPTSVAVHPQVVQKASLSSSGR